MDEPLLNLMRDDLTRRVKSAAANMTDTLRLLAMAREMAGDGPGADSLNAAIEELTSARDGLLVTSR
ncbi:hypothetical protein [Actinoplanes sp. NPDC020271]|uniref:hypothetical protein n=1 Tax=Actinoplanes sp. NPDC020271 TaxID=3363896 RepID=UPI00379EC69C